MKLKNYTQPLALLIVIYLFNSTNCYAYSPKIIAHRGGKDNFPENTIHALRESIKAGSDGLEIDVQVTQDNVVVLYHPIDLSTWTNGKGSVSSHLYNQLQSLDTGYNFNPSKGKSFPERNKGHKIPTLGQVLDLFPNIEIIVDLKSLPAKPLIDAIIKVANEKNAWHQLIFYSTNEKHLNYLQQLKPQANVFESRHITRKRLLSIRNTGICCCEDSSPYVGFELDREMVVEENFTLGSDKNKIHFRLWDKDSVACTSRVKNNLQKIFFFGINNIEDYIHAQKLGAYAVFSDNPIAIIKQLDQINNSQSK
jgi:glycerophosphoryl diester phosphodiesterase